MSVTQKPCILCILKSVWPCSVMLVPIPELAYLVDIVSTTPVKISLEYGQTVRRPCAVRSDRTKFSTRRRFRLPLHPQVLEYAGVLKFTTV